MSQNPENIYTTYNKILQETEIEKSRYNKEINLNCKLSKSITSLQHELELLEIDTKTKKNISKLQSAKEGEVNVLAKLKELQTSRKKILTEIQMFQSKQQKIKLLTEKISIEKQRITNETEKELNVLIQKEETLNSELNSNLHPITNENKTENLPLLTEGHLNLFEATRKIEKFNKKVTKEIGINKTIKNEYLKKKNQSQKDLEMELGKYCNQSEEDKKNSLDINPKEVLAELIDRLELKKAHARSITEDKDITKDAFFLKTFCEEKLRSLKEEIIYQKLKASVPDKVLKGKGSLEEDVTKAVATLIEKKDSLSEVNLGKSSYKIELLQLVEMVIADIKMKRKIIDEMNCEVGLLHKKVEVTDKT